ncbi:MAG: electron transfer flavoprotein subunit alpha/FixB family protein [Deltaproteobacteria bacterium]|nr:electron transfer flavoprotein subunit alpha/FixB family protein [Deltaproteobacteria bacterium]
MGISNLGEWKGIWAFAEQEEGCLAEVSLELLSVAQFLAKKRMAEVSVILLGYGVESLAEQLLAWGADRVFLAEHPTLEKYSTLPYARVTSNLITEIKPEFFLLPATSLGSDLAARVAARVNTGLSAHCTHLDINDKGELRQVVPAFGGKVMATILCPKHRPQMATVRPGVFRKGEPQKKRGMIERVPVEIRPEDLKQKVLEVHRGKGPARAIEEADVVVAGGAGIGNKDDWKWVERLAEVLNGAVGGTRPPLDEGWISEDQMIGQSGKTIRPKLYIGIGISGVIQHVVGIQDAQVIIAINHEPRAAIFQSADLGVIGDFRKIVPLVVDELEKSASSARVDRAILQP